jgi:hypothetical protein
METKNAPPNVVAGARGEPCGPRAPDGTLA